MVLLMMMGTHGRRRSTEVVVVVVNRSPNELLLPVVELLGVEESSGWNPSTRVNA